MVLRMDENKFKNQCFCFVQISRCDTCFYIHFARASVSKRCEQFEIPIHGPDFLLFSNVNLIFLILYLVIMLNMFYCHHANNFDASILQSWKQDNLI